MAGGALSVYVARVNGLSDRTTVQNIAAILGGHMTDAPDERPKQQLIGPRGRFLPGNKFGRGRGRPKGALNKATVGMKALMNATAEKHGSDGKGKDGVGGYMDYLAKTFPEAFAHHLLRATVTPAKEEEPKNGEGGGITSVTIVSIPPGHQQCPDGFFRPEHEAMPLWEVEHARRRAEEHAQQHPAAPLLLQIGHRLPEPGRSEERAVIDVQGIDAELLAELNTLSIEELMVRAGVSDVDKS